MVRTALIHQDLPHRMAALHSACINLLQEETLESLLQRIAIIACEQVGAQNAVASLNAEKDRLDMFMPAGFDPREADFIRHLPADSRLMDVLGQCGNLPDGTGLSKETEARLRSNGFLSVPIRNGDHHLGQIHLVSRSGVRDFSKDEMFMIETLAAYSAAAITNVSISQRLVDHEHMLDRRSESLALMQKLSSSLTTSPDIDELLDLLLSQVMNYLRLEICEIYLREDDSNLLKLVIHRGGLVKSLWSRSEFIIGDDSTVGKTAGSGQNLVITVAEQSLDDLSSIALDEDIRQIGVFPLRGRSGSLGVLCIATRRSTDLDNLEMQFLDSSCSWMATAIENVRLNIQQRRMAVLEERERIGMDLHDGIIQSIYAVGLTLEHARLLLGDDSQPARERMEQAILGLNSAIRDIRSYILDLRPRQLTDENLIKGIQRLLAEFRANTLVEVSLEAPAGFLQQLPPNLALALFHICQEALANIAKHAHAHRVEVSLWNTPERFLMEVRDDGLGFQMETVKQALGHGLSNMQTRAHNVGGDVEISSDVGEGTAVLAWVPYSAV
jgi:two-component system, NarL family, sensor histidine kinase DevS